MSHSIAIEMNTSRAGLVDLSNVATFHAKDPVSSLTHFIACIAAVIATPILLIHASFCNANVGELISLAVFMISMVMLYGASASYHGFSLNERPSMWLKKLDHMMISVLIAGSYTPVCVIELSKAGSIGRILLIAIWSMAILGILFKLFWVTCPKWISSTIYIAMGWAVIFAMPALISVASKATVIWLFIGGVIYTVGGVIYALKLGRFNSRDSLWGSHEIFHLCVMGGSLCHFISIYKLF